jgi:hypothetical protein
MDEAREKYEERLMDRLVRNEEEWRAREVYCQHQGRRAHYYASRGLSEVTLCKRDDVWASESDCQRCNHRGEVSHA